MKIRIVHDDKLVFKMFVELLLEPTENVYHAANDLPYLNGQIRIAFTPGNECLESSTGNPMDGKILIGFCIVAGGYDARAIARKGVSIRSITNVERMNSS